MNVYIKQQASSAICRLAPQLCGTTLHKHSTGLICTLQLSLSWWQCNIKTSLHTMCALVTPLEEGIFGVGHIAGLEPNTSALKVSRKKGDSRIPFFGLKQIFQYGFKEPKLLWPRWLLPLAHIFSSLQQLLHFDAANTVQQHCIASASKGRERQQVM